MADYNTKTKYYFYKLYNDFFDMDVIEHLKRTETGFKTIIIYQQLIFRTINKSGYLLKTLGDEIIPYTIKDLAIKLGEEEKEFEKHFKKLIKYKLIEEVNDIYYIPAGIKLVEKTDGARRKEDQRATQQAKENDPSFCPPLCPPEIKKDIEERNKNIDIRNLEVDLDDRTSGFDLYCAFIKKTEERFGRKLGSDESDRLKYLIDIYGQEEVLYALNESSRVEKLSVGYMEGILTNRSGENPNLYY